MLREMQLQDVEPDVISYTVATSAGEKDAQPEQASGLPREIERRSAESDVISYSSASSACECGARLEQGLQWLREMQLQCIKPDVVSYTAAISAGAVFMSYQRCKMPRRRNLLPTMPCGNAGPTNFGGFQREVGAPCGAQMRT